MSYFSLVIHSFNFRFDVALQDDPVWGRFWIVPVLSSLSDGVKDLSGRQVARSTGPTGRIGSNVADICWLFRNPVINTEDLIYSMNKSQNLGQILHT